MAKVSGETLAEGIGIGLMQLQHRLQQIGVITEGVTDLAGYLRILAENGSEVAILVLEVVEEMAGRCSVRSIDDRADVEMYLSHSQRLLETAQTLARNTHVQMTTSPRRPGGYPCRRSKVIRQ